jgi:alpha-galactosidase
MTATGHPGWITLRRAGVLVVLAVAGPVLPRVVYWGADLGPLTAAELAVLPGGGYTPAAPEDSYSDVPFTVSATRAQGWSGWPGLTGHRNGRATQPLFTLTQCARTDDEDRAHVGYRGVDAAAELQLDGELELTTDGVLRHRQTLTSTAARGTDPYTLEDLLTLLPVPEHVVEVLDHAGRWANEARAQRHPLHQGTWLREQRRGRTGPDSPLLFALGAAGVTYRAGELWGVHLGWSGDQRYLAQRLNTGAVVIGAGELLAAGEVILGSGESVTTPWVYAVYSDAGLDGAARRLHALLRRRPHHPRSTRPIVLNTWEAVYFEQSFERLAALADAAAGVGVERFVVDDGWFGSRRDDRSGLGDWQVSPNIWPDGPRSLAALADHVRGLGMDFGLWFEPEMINPDSALARAHPEWVLGTPGRQPPAARNQQVLDVSLPDAFDYLLEQISARVEELGIRYLKWDHNRDLADPVHRSGPKAGRPAVRDQTLATYRLLSALRERHPGLEIESCSSGGARIDLGILEHTDRVWASDCLDPIERIGIVAGISTLLPFELIGTHVSGPRAHTTGRRHDLALRLAVALFGHAGFEWDLTATTPGERADLASWVRLVIGLRPLIHGGTLVRLDRPGDPGTVVTGVVAPDRDRALFSLIRIRTAPRSGTGPLRLDGLDPAQHYRVRRLVLPGAGPPVHTQGGVDDAVDVRASGRQLMGAGLPLPALAPDQAAVLDVRAVSLCASTLS